MERFLQAIPIHMNRDITTLIILMALLKPLRNPPTNEIPQSIRSHLRTSVTILNRLKKKRFGNRWRTDELYIKVNGKWKYYYRALDKHRQTIDFLLPAKKDKQAVLRFLRKAIGEDSKPSLMNIDQSGANQAGLKQFNRNHITRNKIRQCKYLNNIIEQDQRRIKRNTRLMLGFINFYAAQRTLAGIGVMAMIKKGQRKTSEGNKKSPAEKFYALAA